MRLSRLSSLKLRLSRLFFDGQRVGRDRKWGAAVERRERGGEDRHKKVDPFTCKGGAFAVYYVLHHVEERFFSRDDNCNCQLGLPR